MADAELCRQRGWGVGTVLRAVTDVFDTDTVEIVVTAIGEERILARRVSLMDGEKAWECLHESTWCLDTREWVEAEQ